MSEAVETRERLRLNDLKLKAKFEGHVTTTELFGAFVDIGAERDGLVHISQISEEQVNRVADVLKEGDAVTVWVRDVDPDQGRLALTMIEPPERTIDDLEPEQVVPGTVTKLTPYGAFVDIGVGRDGLVHISEMSDEHIARPSDVVQVGDRIDVRIVKVNQRRRRIELSLLGTQEAETAGELEDEGQEPAMTAMELAWRNAMEQQGIKVPAKSKGRRQRKADIRRAQASIIARTLQAKKD
jgi:small subunit ribosomal protein S1